MSSIIPGSRGSPTFSRSRPSSSNSWFGRKVSSALWYFGEVVLTIIAVAAAAFLIHSLIRMLFPPAPIKIPWSNQVKKFDCNGSTVTVGPHHKNSQENSIWFIAHNTRYYIGVPRIDPKQFKTLLVRDRSAMFTFSSAGEKKILQVEIEGKQTPKQRWFITSSRDPIRSSSVCCGPQLAFTYLPRPLSPNEINQKLEFILRHSGEETIVAMQEQDGVVASYHVNRQIFCWAPPDKEMVMEEKRPCDPALLNPQFVVAILPDIVFRKDKKPNEETDQLTINHRPATEVFLQGHWLSRKIFEEAVKGDSKLLLPLWVLVADYVGMSSTLESKFLRVISASKPV